MLCTLLDVALGTAARLSVGRPVVTLDMQTRFLNPGRGVLLAEGRVTRPGRAVIFCEAEIRDADGAPVASATGLLKPVSERSAFSAAHPVTIELTAARRGGKASVMTMPDDARAAWLRLPPRPMSRP